MSRVGKKVIPIPSGVQVLQKEETVTVKGPKGELSLLLPRGISVKMEEKELRVERLSDEKWNRSLHGTINSLLSNMVEGVTKGFQKELQIEGVGFRAQSKGKTLSMQLGFSHTIEFQIPEGITIQTPNQNQVIVQGIDKMRVGQTASEIRAFYKPEPYKGKGIRYAGEVVRRKAGKTVA